jgi:hypothetical protein
MAQKINYAWWRATACHEFGSKPDSRQNLGEEAEVRHGKSCSSEPNAPLYFNQYKFRKISCSNIKLLRVREKRNADKIQCLKPKAN